QIVERLDRAESVIDVGAGAGRYAVPLTQTARHVTLVEPSPAMAGLAREQLERLGRTNWSLVEAEWLDTEGVAPAAAVLLANVLSPHEDLAAWIGKALDHARRWLFIVHGTVPDALPDASPEARSDAIEPLRRVAIALHGEPRAPQPGLADLLPALHELGVFPDVTMFQRCFGRSYANATEAARDAAASLLIEPTPPALERIRGLLRRHLRKLPDGRVALPEIVAPSALLSWRTDTRQPGGRWRWTRD
ncbi:MAG: class I SAM-dependent methyltransferase, partial [Chloroflexi bacterium]|nr:class I SAM-dependent methyltransferase [Chloroflexota bacterium]